MEKRKVDSLAGKGSMMDALRARREAVESGDIAKASEAYLKTLTPDQPAGVSIQKKKD